MSSPSSSSPADSGDDVVVVVGAGIAGSCAALLLARRGFAVVLAESRADSRAAEAADAAAAAAASAAGLGQSVDPTKRSINLALSARGRAALAEAGVEAAVLAECVRMPCRAIHAGGAGGGVTLQPYGAPGEAIFSASRSLLSRVLLEQCEALGDAGAAGAPPARGRVRLLFGHRFVGVEPVGGAGGGSAVEVELRSTAAGAPALRLRAALVVGADGAYSAVRAALLRQSRASFSREYIAHGYKELTMPCDAMGGPVGRSGDHGVGKFRESPQDRQLAFMDEQRQIDLVDGSDGHGALVRHAEDRPDSGVRHLDVEDRVVHGPTLYDVVVERLGRVD